MENIKNVFINNEGINFYNKGRLASIIDLEEELGLGLEPIEGILQLDDGIYKFINREQQIEILKRDEDVTKEELDECEGEYVKINDDVPESYKKFIKDITDEYGDVEDVISCTIADEMLIAVTRMFVSNVLYIYNYWENKDGEIKSTNTMVYKHMIA